MKTKLVNRYYCEFCIKGGCSKGHMVKHERGCTANPSRVCGMCAISGNKQESMTELIAMLPKRRDLCGPDAIVNGVREMSRHPPIDSVAILLPLRSATDNCPACILAALIQAGIPDMVEFDYRKEHAWFWECVNTDRCS